MLDAVYIATTEAPAMAPRRASEPAKSAQLKGPLALLRALFKAVFVRIDPSSEGSSVAAQVNRSDLVPPDPFSTEHPFLSTSWPHE